MMEIQLTLTCNGFRGSQQTYLCADALRRQIKLPRGVLTIYAVFTKTDKYPRDSYTITLSRDRGSVFEFNGLITYFTRRVLANQYRDGFRFVHFEY